ncbi:hypothetical protein CBR_g26193 [Chara braunii]|uniref:TPM domain-containing protein n=1 Tax=Chara braunii TaxID=69332 RepID=A0A388L7A3_CHABU|nr:hypothetical protein CBR_g26193 [Chara braunii]|eukprot:GBG78158.1 hypothetical protein CBR_g26193 [Chara braunii]
MRTASVVITSVEAGQATPVWSHCASSGGPSWTQATPLPQHLEQVGDSSPWNQWFPTSPDLQPASSKSCYPWKSLWSHFHQPHCCAGKRQTHHVRVRVPCPSPSLRAPNQGWSLHGGCCCIIKPPLCRRASASALGVRKASFTAPLLTPCSRTGAAANRCFAAFLNYTGGVNARGFRCPNKQFPSAMDARSLNLGPLTPGLLHQETVVSWNCKRTAEQWCQDWPSSPSSSKCQKLCLLAFALQTGILPGVESRSSWCSCSGGLWDLNSRPHPVTVAAARMAADGGPTTNRWNRGHRLCLDHLKWATVDAMGPARSAFRRWTANGMANRFTTRGKLHVADNDGRRCSVCLLPSSLAAWRGPRWRSRPSPLSHSAVRSVRLPHCILLTVDEPWCDASGSGSAHACRWFTICRAYHFLRASGRTLNSSTHHLQGKVLMRVHSRDGSGWIRRTNANLRPRRYPARRDPQPRQLPKKPFICGQTPHEPCKSTTPTEPVNEGGKAIGWVTPVRRQPQQVVDGLSDDNRCQQLRSEAYQQLFLKEQSIRNEKNRSKVVAKIFSRWITSLWSFVKGGLKVKLIHSLAHMSRQGGCKGRSKNTDLPSDSCRTGHCIAERSIADEMNPCSLPCVREQSSTRLATTGSAPSTEHELRHHSVPDLSINCRGSVICLVPAAVLLMAGFARQISLLPSANPLRFKAPVAHVCGSRGGKMDASVVVGSPLRREMWEVPDAPCFEDHLHDLPFASIKLGGRHMIRKTTKVNGVEDRKLKGDQKDPIRKEDQERQKGKVAPSPSRVEEVLEVVPPLHSYPSDRMDASFGPPPLLPQSGVGECLKEQGGGIRPTPPSYRVWQDGGTHICSEMYLGGEDTVLKDGVVPDKRSVEGANPELEAGEGGKERLGRSVVRIGTARVIRDKRQRRGRHRRRQKPMTTTVAASGSDPRVQKQYAKKRDANKPISKVYVGLGEEVEVIRLGEWEWSNAELAPVDLSVAGAEEYNSVVEVPNPRKWGYWVSDQARVLSREEVDSLNRTITEMYNSTGVDMTIVTVKRVGTTVGSADSLARRLYHYWGLGVEREGCGVLLLMVTDSGRVEVEVGERLGDKLDLVRRSSGELGSQGGRWGADRGGSCWVKWLKEKRIRPKMRLGRYGAAVMAGVNEVVERVAELYGDAPKPSMYVPARRRLQVVDALWMGLISFLVAGGIWMHCGKALRKFGLSRSTNYPNVKRYLAKGSGKETAGDVLNRLIRRFHEKGGNPVWDLYMLSKGAPRVMLGPVDGLGFLHRQRSKQSAASDRRAEVTDSSVWLYAQGERTRPGSVALDLESTDKECGKRTVDGGHSRLAWCQAEPKESASLRPSRRSPLFGGLLKGKKMDPEGENCCGSAQSGRLSLSREGPDDEARATRVTDTEDGEHGILAWGTAVQPIILDG